MYIDLLVRSISAIPLSFPRLRPMQAALSFPFIRTSEACQAKSYLGSDVDWGIIENLWTPRYYGTPGDSTQCSIADRLGSDPS